MVGCKKFYVSGWNQWEVVEAAAGALELFGASLPEGKTGPQVGHRQPLTYGWCTCLSLVVPPRRGGKRPLAGDLPVRLPSCDALTYDTYKLTFL